MRYSKIDDERRMKKIFYFLLLMISGIVWGQPTIYPLTGGFTFEGQTLINNTQVFAATTPNGTGCGFQFTTSYKYFSFRAEFDMVFAFDLNSKTSDFNFLVWKLSKGKAPNSIFERGGTIVADRSVYDKTILSKGMREGDIDMCQNGSGNGYVEAFEGTNILKAGETVVIAVYGLNNSDTFDIKVNVAEEREIPHSIFNNLCKGQTYSYQQVVDAIKSHISSNSNPVANPDIKLYRDNTFNTLINDASTIFNTNTTLYAQVRDTAGNLKFIYTIPIAFILEHQFNFKTNIETEYTCTTSYTIPS